MRQLLLIIQFFSVVSLFGQQPINGKWRVISLKERGGYDQSRIYVDDKISIPKWKDCSIEFNTDSLIKIKLEFNFFGKFQKTDSSKIIIKPFYDLTSDLLTKEQDDFLALINGVNTYKFNADTLILFVGDSTNTIHLIKVNDRMTHNFLNIHRWNTKEDSILYCRKYQVKQTIKANASLDFWVYDIFGNYLFRSETNNLDISKIPKGTYYTMFNNTIEGTREFYKYE